MGILLFISVLLVAACGLIYELVAGTLASYLVGDSVFQFSTIIGTYLFAMGIAHRGEQRVGLRLPHRRWQVEVRDEHDQPGGARGEQHARLLAHGPLPWKRQRARLERLSAQQLGGREERIAVRAPLQRERRRETGGHAQRRSQPGRLVGAAAASAPDVHLLQAGEVRPRLPQEIGERGEAAELGVLDVEGREAHAVLVPWLRGTCMLHAVGYPTRPHGPTRPAPGAAPLHAARSPFPRAGLPLPRQGARQLLL